MVRDHKMTNKLPIGRQHRAAIALIIILLVSAGTYMKQAEAVEENLEPLADTLIVENLPNLNRGDQTFLRVSHSDVQNRRTLVQFDLDQIASAIAGSLISATLQLEIDANNNNWGTGGLVDIHRVTTAWSEMGATWICPNDTDTSNTQPDCNDQWAGGSFISTPTDTVTIINGQTGTIEFDVTSDVVAFLAGTPNNGWIIKKTDETASGLVDFKSREAGTPKLIITFELSGGSGCRAMTIINSETIANAPSHSDYTRCTIIDDEPPRIVKAFVTPSDNVCIETQDNTQTVRVTYNGNEMPRSAGSGNGTFCTNDPLPTVILVVAEDSAGNLSEMTAVDIHGTFTTQTEQAFTAIVSKELNPHQGVEGIILSSVDVVKQVRLARSPEFSNEGVLHLSETTMKELSGEQTIVVTYKGPYVDREGQIYVFGTNRGLLATFDVMVDVNDIRLSLHQEKPRHGTYTMKLSDSAAIDNMDLNAWQKVELETVFAGNEDLTLVQKNILSLVLRLSSGL